MAEGKEEKRTDYRLVLTENEDTKLTLAVVFMARGMRGICTP